MLTTERLTLVPHAPEHFDDYAAFWAKDPGYFLRGLAPMRTEDAWARILRFHGHWQHFGWGPFLGYDDAGKLVVDAGYADNRRGLGARFDSAPEGMWKVDLDAQGWGLATEAMAAVTSWLDQTHRPARTVCLIHPDNLASIRVAGKLGFAEFERTTYKDGPVAMFERLAP